MNTENIINKMLNSEMEVYKEIEFSGITYLFQNEIVYKKFMENEIYKWTDRIPKYALNKFVEDEFKILCVSETIVNKEHKADGTFIYALNEDGKKANMIVVEIDDNPSVLYHEFGHYIDVRLGDVPCKYSQDIALKAIILYEGTYFTSAFVIDYEEHGMMRKNVIENKITGYAQSIYFLDAPEFFAQSFAIYMMNEKLLRRLCPETFKYIDEIYCSLYMEDVT